MSQHRENPLTGYMMAAVMIIVGLMAIIAGQQVNTSKMEKMISDIAYKRESCEKRLVNTETKWRTRNHEHHNHRR